jgi:hypothetical protein
MGWIRRNKRNRATMEERSTSTMGGSASNVCWRLDERFSSSHGKFFSVVDVVRVRYLLL